MDEEREKDGRVEWGTKVLILIGKENFMTNHEHTEGTGRTQRELRQS